MKSHLAASIRLGQVTVEDATRDFLERIFARNPELNAFITVTDEAAMASAAVLDSEILAGKWRGPLHGMSVAVKDLVMTNGIRTTMGSRLYSDFVPELDATVVRRLRNAGAVIVGKTNTHEFAYGPTGDKSAFGPARNPHDVTRMTGGSSSGSAAAVAANLCFGAIGTDTGGSVRIPAALCGVVGMKPTFGRVSKHGVFPLSDSLDHVGPLTRTVVDNAHLLAVIAGHDVADRHTVERQDTDFLREAGRPVKGLTVGVLKSYFFDQLEPGVATAMERTITQMSQLGVRIVEVELPHLADILAAQPIVQKSEAYALHRERVTTHASLLDPELVERLVASAEPRGYEYVEAMSMRPRIIKEVDALFDNGVDVLMTPAVPITAPHIFQREVTLSGEVLDVRRQLLRCTHPFNYTGQPALALPCAKSTEGLPIAVQFIGRSFDEAMLYRFGFQLEKTFPEVSHS